HATAAHLRGQRALVRSGHLHGDALHHARHVLAEEESHQKHLLRELRPLRRQRSVVTSVEGLLHSQESGITAAIREAQRQHLGHGVIGHLHSQFRHDKGLAHWMNWWLDKKWYTPTAHQRRRDDRRATADLTASLRSVGLPLAGF